MALSPKNIAVCSWSLQPSSIDDLIAKVKSVGVNRVQLHLNPIFEGGEGRHSEGTAADWVDAGQKLKAAGIEIVSGMVTTFGEDYTSHETIKVTGGIVPGKHWARNQETARQAADLAAEMGLDSVSFHAGYIPHDPSCTEFEEMVRRMQAFANYFGAHGIDLLLETGQESADDLITFLIATGRPNVGVNFDPANMLLYGMGAPIASLQRLMAFVRQIHIKDAFASPETGVWGSEEPVGQGEVDWRAFFSALKHARYDGALVIEREAGDDRQADIKTAVQYVTEVLSSKHGCH